ncbi:MAG TPA: hypothetical protein VFC09_16475 [Candidatus Dormibacteraeota bacterium]|nr:hypothetical protein [Candidatus Dormibacteraeota bacterium]
MFDLRVAGLRRCVVALTLAAVMAAPLPAQAQEAGVTAGVASATFSYSPGFAFPPAPVSDQTFSLSGSMTGAIAGAGSLNEAGTYTASLTGSGSSIVENLATGVGSIDVTGSGEINCTAGCVGLSPIVIQCRGFYYRWDGHIYFWLTCTVSIDGVPIITFVICFYGVLIYNQLPPAPITSASFAGTYNGAGITP